LWPEGGEFDAALAMRIEARAAASEPTAGRNLRGGGVEAISVTACACNVLCKYLGAALPLLHAATECLASLFENPANLYDEHSPIR
jgi:hypothetical protein